jgi:hypothetical protein
VSPDSNLGARSEHCDTCALTQLIADQETRRTDTYDAVAVDEDVVVLSSPGFLGLVVIPRHHVSGLWELPSPERARVLAALRRVSLSIGGEPDGSDPSIVVATDPPASKGHVCFQVVPRRRRGV